MEIYEKQLRAPAEGLTTRGLFIWLQDIAGDQCVGYHLAEPDMKARGLMWVVIRYLLRAERWPEPGEALRLQTWPGQSRHGMMPRYYRLLDGAGTCLVSACGIWAVVDRETRKMVIPEEHGVFLEALVTGLEERRPGAPLRLPAAESMEYTVTEDVLDGNGHMNNTCYYDLAERCIGREGGHPRRVVTEHQSEIRLGQRMLVRWGQEGERYYIEGGNETPVFRMNLAY